MPLNYPVLYKSMDAKSDQIVSNAVAAAIADAEKLWAPEPFDGVFPTRGFGIRKLEKFDLARNAAGTDAGTAVYTNSWLMSIATARTWSQIMSCTLSDSLYVVLTGIFNYDANPDVRAIKITADGIEYPTIPLYEMYGWDIATAYFSHPIIVRPEKKFVLEAVAENAGQKELGFLGYTIAKRSYIIGKI